jgi:hypothetical protein
MEQVYALFDRRCRTQTALAKLAKLRRRVQRFTALRATLKKLFAPTLDKALTFLDDKLLPSTSNAVERGNRRYRKRQKQVYRVRTQGQIRARLDVCFVNPSPVFCLDKAGDDGHSQRRPISVTSYTR